MKISKTKYNENSCDVERRIVEVPKLENFMDFPGGETLFYIFRVE